MVSCQGIDIVNHNVGSADKAVRSILGAAIISAGVYFKSWWGVVGAVPLLTALIGWCPAYSLLGVQTSSKSNA